LDLYVFMKTLHVLSATVLFGTGAGTAFFMLQGHLSRVPAARRFAAAATVRADFLFNPAEGHAIEIEGNLAAAFDRFSPDVVVHTTCPFQRQDHRRARACIAQGCHYLDLADARDFVVSIGELDAAARERGVIVVNGGSSVPCLTATVIDHYRPGFTRLDAIDYGISTAQQTNRGLATTLAVLSYVGKPLLRLRDGRMQQVFGWQDTPAVHCPELALRLFGNCDIPDLDLFPDDIRTCTASASPPGMS
jgi:hypothetical protein